MIGIPIGIAPTVIRIRQFAGFVAVCLYLASVRLVVTINGASERYQTSYCVYWATF